MSAFRSEVGGEQPACKPSGGAFAARSAPSTPAAPGGLSSIWVYWPRLSESFLRDDAAELCRSTRPARRVGDDHPHRPGPIAPCAAAAVAREGASSAAANTSFLMRSPSSQA
jgi:hypothetical protein